MVGSETRHQHQPSTMHLRFLGCIRLTRQDVIELYGRVRCGGAGPRPCYRRCPTVNLSIFISCVGYPTTGTALRCQDGPAQGRRREGASMRLPILLSDIVLVFCLAAFIAGLMIAAASLLS
jgi:hypothetical protein